MPCETLLTVACGLRSLLRVSLALVAIALAPYLSAGDWPQFRGPTGQGHAASSKLPLTWSESENVVWKVPIPGNGWSSPVIRDGQLWLTTATEGGRSLRALAIDAESGTALHDIELFRYDDPPKIHKKNGYASPTPVLEPGRVYVHFGTQGTAALTSDGEVLWKTQKLRYYHRHGSSGSAVLSHGLLLINCDGYDIQYVVALDKEIGRIRWKTYRRGARHAYATPLVVRAGNREQLISPGAKRAVSYDVETGEELWWVRYDGYSNVPQPVFAHGLAFITSGFEKPVLLAVRPNGRGDVTDSHVVWRWDRGVPHTPSPLVVGDELYFVSDKGIATCLDARTGREHWRARLGGNFAASPVFAAGRIYFLNESGETIVVKPGRTFHKLAQNRLDATTLASMAVIGDVIFIRSESHLYRIEERQDAIPNR